MEIIKKGFGEQLKAHRKIKNLTQEKLSEMIGINLRQLARIEAGESFITAETLYNLCTVLEISPKSLFDFSIKDELLITNSENKVHLKVIRNKNTIQSINNKLLDACTNNNDDDGNVNFENRVLKVAQNINKEIIVEEFENGSIFQTKIYKPNGDIEIANKNSNEINYNILITDIENIKNDKNKIDYMTLAYNSLTSRKDLEELKTMIKGIELTLE